MCGIAGILGGNRNSEVDLRLMTDSLIHRGPDDSGLWSDKVNQISLGHRRLSIVDLSPAGHQPMISASGRYVIAFNGEIYNHLSLRALLGVRAGSLSTPFRGHSDTETLLFCFEEWGIQTTIEKAIGMFAISVWDRQTRVLTLIRDRIGEKPLYYGWQGDSFIFGSELKALKAHSSFHASVDRDALCLFMRHNYIPAPYSIYKGISKLQPGCMLTVSLDQKEPTNSTYWSATKVSEEGVANPFKGTFEEAVNELERLLKDAVRQQMMADVPLGAFLSGGVDSSAIVALMQSQSDRPVKTFTIGFSEQSYNEAVYAKAVAKHLGTDHTELYVTADQAIGVIPKLPNLYCEPFSDSSQIPTFLVSQLAKKEVTVSLSGDAGDELFCGYNRYLLTSNFWKKLSVLPLCIRSLISRCLLGVSVNSWNKILFPVQSLMPHTLRLANIGQKFHKGADVLTSESANELYYKMVSHWHQPSSVVINGQEPATLLTGLAPLLKGLNNIQRMMVLDLLTYLPDDILVKVDRAAMGVSLESRVPFLDHRVVEFAMKLPMEYKLNKGKTKWALRQVLYRHVPKELIERPKMGFGIPVENWLKGTLKDWVESLINEDRLKKEGFFNPVPIRQKWQEHLSGKRNWHYYLWDVLMFQAWLENEKNIDKKVI